MVQRERTTAPGDITISHDPIAEGQLLAAALVSAALRQTLVSKFTAEYFFEPKHKVIWTALCELERKKLAFDLPTLQSLDKAVDVQYCRDLVENCPTAPTNIEHYIDRMYWDYARLTAANGPIKQLVGAVNDPKSEVSRVKALAKQVGDSFENYKSKLMFRDSSDLCREIRAGVEEARAGHAIYAFGIQRLDYYEDGKPRMIPGLAPGLTTAITGSSGHGKALDINTPIPTPDGWKWMRDLNVGDEVFDENGSPCKVEACTGVIRNRECFEILFSDGTKIVADGEHQWKTISHAERVAATHRNEEFREKRRLARGYLTRRPQVSATAISNAVASGKLIPIGGSIRTTKEIRDTLFHQVRGRFKAKNHAIPLAGSLQLPEMDLLVDPYVFGAWLGDGCSNHASITSADFEVVAEIANAGHSIRQRSAKYLHGIGQLQEKLRDLQVLNNKHIPPDYLRASHRQRLSLLQGLMDTDGSCYCEGKECEFVTTSEALANGMQELLATLGIKSSRKEGVAKLHGRVVSKKWRFTFTSKLPVFRLPRKLGRMVAPVRGMEQRRYIVDVRPVKSVPVRCIQVSSASKMYLAGEAMIPTHNSILTAKIVLEQARMKRKVLYGAWEMNSARTLQMLGCMSCAFDRTRLKMKDGEGGLTSEELELLMVRCKAISKYVSFMDDTIFGKVKGKPSNERNLDILYEHIQKSGADIIALDLFKRCLVQTKPEEEELAIAQMQRIALEMKVHLLLVQQQRLKDVEKRPDQRPTREGIKGSAMWVEAPDNILGVFNPSKVKDIVDNTFEIVILKQRDGVWPMAVEFDYDPATTILTNGRTVPYNLGSDSGSAEDYFRSEKAKGRKK